jgi:hypothetical protein
MNAIGALSWLLLMLALSDERNCRAAALIAKASPRAGPLHETTT